MKEMSRKKIIQLCTLDSGGAGKAALRLNTGLASIGVDSAMIVALKQSQDPAVSVVEQGDSPGLRGENRRYQQDLTTLTNHWGALANGHPGRPQGLEMFSDTRAFYRLDHLEAIRKADIIHFHWITGLLNPEVIPLLRGKKVVWTLHDMNPFTGGCHYAGDCDRYRFSCGACPQLGSSLETDLSRDVWGQKNRAYRELDLTVVAPSRWMASCASASSLFRGFPVTVIPNGIPVETFRPLPTSELRKRLNIPEGAKIVLFGADHLINRRKGFAFLLEALRSYVPKAAGTPIYLAVFGKVDPGQEIPSVHPVLNFGSIANEQDLAALYSLADVFVLPSLEDNLPNTVLEAMACGTPVVGFDTGGIPDMISHKGNGFLARPKDVASLAEGIDWCLFGCDRDLISRACRESVLERHSQQAQSRAYAALYDGVGRHSRPAPESTRQIRPAVTVATSIAPKEIEKQQAAIGTWLDLGMRVRSVNSAEEIRLLQPHFPEVTFVAAARDSREFNGRPLIYFDDILKSLDTDGSGTCGIINSDIHLRADGGFLEFIAREARNSFVYGSRMDIESADHSTGTYYDNGFDFFFFDREAIGLYPPTSFAIGATWWDYWIVSVPLLRRYPVKKITSPVAFHVEHPRNWSQEEWYSLGCLFRSYLRALDFDFFTQDFEASAYRLLDRINAGSLPLSYAPAEKAPPAPERRYLVSALVSTYNAEAFFDGCLRNLIDQTLYKKGLLEIIIINSGSQQGEEKIARSYMEKHDHIVYRRTERETLYAAWNRGIQLARGTYITHANTDDRHRSDAFEIMAGALERQQAGLVYVDAMMTCQRNETFERNSAGKNWLLPDFNLRQALIDCPFGCQVMWRASAHADVGMFDPGYKRAGDYEFFLRLALRHGALHHPEILALYHESLSNLSYEAPEEVIREVRRFIKAQRENIPLETIYPYLSRDHSLAARVAALVDFGNHLMGASATLFTDIPMAEALYRKALELAPGEPEVAGNLAVACMVQGKNEAAIAATRSARRQTPRLEHYLSLLRRGESPQLTLTSITYPGLDAMQPVKLPQQIRVLREGGETRPPVPFPSARPSAAPRAHGALPTVAIDGVFFLGSGVGIGRVWYCLLKEWAQTEFGKSIVVIDRVGTTPKVPGIRYRTVPVYDFNPPGWDRAMLQQVCDQEGVDIFMSTYYTTPLSTPSIFMAYDMIPEFTNFFDLSDPQWQEKHHAISRASAFVAISHSTANDLGKLYPELADRVAVAYCGLDREFFHPATAGEIQGLRERYGIDKPYFLFVGGREWYKNGQLLLEAFVRLPDKEKYLLLCVGGLPELEPRFKAIAGNADVRVISLPDTELRIAYSGAVAFIYPSRYEGFGLPILEAMGCDCPVITCHHSSIPEVAGAAALYVDPDNAEQLATAMHQVAMPEVRQQLIKMGSRQAKKFSWKTMADTVQNVICNHFDYLKKKGS